VIKVNGNFRGRPDGTLLDLLMEEGIDRSARGVAVALNGAVLPRSRWPETGLADGDEIEIVKVMQGG